MYIAACKSERIIDIISIQPINSKCVLVYVCVRRKVVDK